MNGMLGWNMNLGNARGAGVTLGKTFIIDGGADFNPALQTISGSASYPDYDYEMTGTGSIGSLTFTRTGGDPIADLGATNARQVVLEDASGNLEMNAAKGYSGSDVTLLYPPTIAATKLHQGFQGANAQHLSPKGAAALAQHALNYTRGKAYQEKAYLALYHDDVFTTTPWSAVSDDKVWKPYGGMAGNGFAYSSRANVFNGTFDVYVAAVDSIQVDTDAQGEGMNLTWPTNNVDSWFTMTLGALQANGTLNVTILHDGVEAFNEDYNHVLNRVHHFVPESVDEIEVRATRTNVTGDGTIRMRLGAASLCDISAIASERNDTVIPSTASVLLIGDSWIAATNTNGAPFVAEFEAQHNGTVYDEAIGGSQITAWKDSVSGWLLTYNPDVVMMHTGINEHNAGMGSETLWNHIKDVEQLVIAAGKIFVLLMQGTTASYGQAQELLTRFNQFERDGYDKNPYSLRYPRLDGEFITEAAANEFTNSASVINNRNKVPTTRTVTRISDSAVLTPTGTDPSDSWETA